MFESIHRNRAHRSSGRARAVQGAVLGLLVVIWTGCVGPGTASRVRHYSAPSEVPVTIEAVMRPPSADIHRELGALSNASRNQPGSRLRRAFLHIHQGLASEAVVELNLVIHSSTPPAPQVEAMARALRARALRLLGQRERAIHDEQLARQLSNDPKLLALLETRPLAHPIGSTRDLHLADLVILPRSEWSARRAKPSKLDRMGPISRLTVHHSATAIRNDSKSQAVASIRAIQFGHHDRGYADIGYHFVIDPAGRIWEGRSTQFLGAHVKNGNSGNLGICMLGDLRPNHSGAPPRAQTESLERLLLALMTDYGLGPDVVRTHQELGRGTECPGPYLARQIDDFRSRLRAGLAE